MEPQTKYFVYEDYSVQIRAGLLPLLFLMLHIYS